MMPYQYFRQRLHARGFFVDVFMSEVNYDSAFEEATGICNQVRCDQCVSSQCSYAVHYTEGSSIRGQIVQVFRTPRHPQSSLQIAPQLRLSLQKGLGKPHQHLCLCL